MKHPLNGTLTCTILAGIAVPLLLTACAREDDATEVDMEFSTVSYQCENGERLEVKYGNAKLGPGIALLNYQNKLISMHQERAASGALYVADKGQPLYRWHTQGDEGMLSRQSAGDDGDEELLKECRAGS